MGGQRPTGGARISPVFPVYLPLLQATGSVKRSNVEIETALQAIDRETLNPPVRKALDSETATVTDWQVTPLPAERRNVFRFTGNARTADKKVAWSLVLKVVGRERTSGRREAQANASGLLCDLPGGLAAARCFGVEAHGDTFRIWQEEVMDEVDRPWPLARYSLAARHLGQLNGAYLVGHPLPTGPWVLREWIRSEVAEEEALDVARPPRLPDHPLSRRAFPGRSVDDLLRFWADRELFLAALDRLPKTFGHLDAAPSNVFVRRGSSGPAQTVAIDWSHAGIAEIGHDIAPLVFYSLLDDRWDPAQTEALDERVFAGYVSGLQEAGWSGDPSAARFGVAASLALRYGLSCLRRPLSYGLDKSGQTWVEQVRGRPIEEVLDRFAAVHRFVLGRADEARRLLAVIH